MATRKNAAYRVRGMLSNIGRTLGDDAHLQLPV